MKIAIEAQRIFRPDKHGMDFVILEVLRQLQNWDNNNEYFVFTAPGEDHCLENTVRMHIIELHCPTYPLWEQWALPRAVRKCGAELLHCTSNTAPLYSPIPIILTLHDIIFLQSKKPKGMSRYQQLGWYYRRWNVPRIINRCSHIITVSETEEKNILMRFPKLKDKLSVIHNGYSDCFCPLEMSYDITHKYLSEPEYILFLGNTDPRKNTEGVLRAYQQYLNSSKRRLKLVITGLAKEYVEKLLISMGLESCSPNIVYTGYVPSDDLPALYNGAFAFLFPSLLEGFGIPVLEAMACGTPVITSNCSSLPEVAGKDALLINPFCPNDIADALIKLESDAELYHKQVNYGLQHAMLFSWKNTAKGYLNVYNATYI